MWYICQAYITNHITQCESRVFGIYIRPLRVSLLVILLYDMRHYFSVLWCFGLYELLQTVTIRNDIAFINANALSCNICLRTELSNSTSFAIELLKFCNNFASVRSFEILQKNCFIYMCSKVYTFL